jgi:predicted house-cleaning noncanonical NTP pyrophosphatase (MazG superfamily)
MPSYQKLVRDRIPEIIKAAGKKPVTHILEEAAYLDELDRKLNEECEEYQESKSLEELADMLEVMYAIAEARGSSIAELEAIRKKKAAERGGFRDRVYLDGVENQT